MSIAIPLILFVLFSTHLWLMHRTGSAFPGTPLLATRDHNARLFGSYYFTGYVAVIGTFIWLVIALVQEFLA